MSNLILPTPKYKRFLVDEKFPSTKSSEQLNQILRTRIFLINLKFLISWVGGSIDCFRYGKLGTNHSERKTEQVISIKLIKYYLRKIKKCINMVFLKRLLCRIIFYKKIHHLTV